VEKITFAFRKENGCEANQSLVEELKDIQIGDKIYRERIIKNRCEAIDMNYIKIKFALSKLNFIS
jgi:hypothetical protein